MRAILHRLVFSVSLLILVAANASAATYDWVGTTLTGSVYDWNNKLNWQVGGVAATAVPGAADIVRIAVVAYTNDPTITTAQTCASVILGNYDNFTLTVNGSLTVAGDITQTNDPNFYQYTTLTGTGSITCVNFRLGDNTMPNTGMGVVNNVSCQVNQITISGNLYLNSAGNSTGDGIEYPYFSLDANKMTLSGQITTTTFSNPLSGGTADPTYPGLGLFQMDSFAAATTLELLNANPLVTPITTGFTIDFTNNGAGAGTVIYGATSGTQAVYTTATTGIGINAYNYDYLTFAGASTKVLAGGNLTIGNDWTTGGAGTVNLSTNNPTITVTDNWVNSTNVTQGSGNITVSNTLQNNSNTITLGTGTLSVTNILQINGGTVSTGAGTVTVNGTYQNNAGTLACGSGNVIFKGAYSNSGTFTAGTGFVYFSGASQSLTDNSASGTTFNKVTFNGTGAATMNAGTGNFAVSATGILTVTSPATLTAGSAAAAYLTLKSTASGSATVSALTGTAAINGFVNVQRYITGGSSAYRGYRLLTSPVYVANVSGNNVYNYDYLKSSMLLSGAAGGGFDKTGNPSLYMYRENQAFSTTAFTLGNFSEVTKINNSPTYNIYADGIATNYNPLPGNGFLVFFRGDRTTNLANKYTPGTAAESVTVTATGSLNQGQITVHDWYTPASANLGYTVTAGNATVRGFNLVGNPYASSIDWDTYNTTTMGTGIYVTSIGGTIYVLDPTTKNYGAYTKGSGGVGTHNTSNIIPQGQGFFVLASSASAKLVFNESAKTAAQVTGPNLLMGVPADRSYVQYLHLQLTKDSVNNDDILIRFHKDATAAFADSEDAPHKPGFGQESLSSLSNDGTALAINVLPLPTKDLQIDLSVGANTNGTYSMDMKGIVGVPELFNVFLIDKYAGTTIDMRKNPTYSFDIVKSDSASFGDHRFSIVMKQDTALAYHLVDFNAVNVAATPSRQARITWSAINEQNYTRFTVERSSDNLNFEVVGGVQSNGQGTYSLMDKTPGTGENYYRLKQSDINDSISYSKVVRLEYTKFAAGLESSVNVYPNPTNGPINVLVLPGVTKSTNFRIKIANTQGLVVKEVDTRQPTWSGNLNGLHAGSYLVQIIDVRNNAIVGKSKLVKL